MERNITVKELNETIKNNRKLLEDLKLERERVRIGFLDSETPRLMKLLTDTINLIEKLTGDLIAGRRELKRVLRKERKLTKAQEPEIKPIPLAPKISKRAKKKAKATGHPFIPSRKNPIVT